MPADARGGEQPRAGKEKSSMYLVGKRQAEEKRRQLYFAGMVGQNFLMKTSSCLKNKSKEKQYFLHSKKKKKKKRQEGKLKF